MSFSPVHAKRVPRLPLDLFSISVHTSTLSTLTPSSQLLPLLSEGCLRAQLVVCTRMQREKVENLHSLNQWPISGYKLKLWLLRSGSGRHRGVSYTACSSPPWEPLSPLLASLWHSRYVHWILNWVLPSSFLLLQCWVGISSNAS